jgi:hypothetical protein
MSVWYPQLSKREWQTSASIALLGALLAGLYGSVHDQVSFSISREYFTAIKFRQFAYANFGLPERLFVAEIGFLASWWVGLIAGWVLARVGLSELAMVSGWRYVAKAFAIVTVVGIASGCIAILLGMKDAAGDLDRWEGWRLRIGDEAIRGFILVYYLHWGSYLGAVIGAIAAFVYVRRCRSQTRKKLPKAPNESPPAPGAP